MYRSILLAFLLPVSGWAEGGRACSEHVLKDPKALAMVNYLQEQSGRYRLGSCQAEIQVCQNQVSTSDSTSSSLIGEMLIIDQEGFERYIPFYFAQYKHNRSSEIVLQNSRMLHYAFKDTNYDQASGTDERWMVEFIKSADLKRLDYIEIGYSSQVQRQKKMPKKWIICGAEREHEVYGHPWRHMWRSWWHRLTN